MMAGAPPVKEVSVAVTSTTPFSENESVEPVTVRFNWVPAARAPDGWAEPSCVQLPLTSLNSISSGLPLFHQ